MQKIASNQSFGGLQQRFTHTSEVLNCEMTLAVYLPPQAQQQNVPVVYWLSGLTCTDENFVQKAGAQRVAAELGVMLVIPDTSPRGEEVPDAPDGAYDLGKGAGFYVNASQAPWDQHYRMYDYITIELPKLITSHFPVKPGKAAICGHSMGGHGALTIGMRNPEKYCSISAFSPIVAPSTCDWGRKALSTYLGDDESVWAAYDSCKLIEQREGQHVQPILIDQGTSDEFFDSQLLTRPFDEISQQQQRDNIDVRYQPGYDHSYFFVASFIEDHLRFHAKHLNAQ
ncbi:S-formylglutathione hydrolase [Aestuariibacter salexigens]|uniref:S-formylglutathione hydrolase n=1 Tax=Aestuariibacter salexigens TaxID=226010 RepID=UPI00146FC198|nr:S-formylglutathione hydrolase [Aestuariibacter salexigens]